MTITKKDLKEALKHQDGRLKEALKQQDGRLKEALKQQDGKLKEALKQQDEKLKEALKQQDGRLKKELKQQDERFAERLLKHFYTKDEIDQKLSQHPTKEDLKKAVDEGIDRVKVLFEDNKSKTVLVAEGHDHLNKKVQDLDNRIKKLEQNV